MSTYPTSPPSYQTAGPNTRLGAVPPDEEAGRPLLHPAAGPSAGGYFDEPRPGDLPDDFKVLGSSAYLNSNLTRHFISTGHALLTALQKSGMRSFAKCTLSSVSSLRIVAQNIDLPFYAQLSK